MRRLQPLSEALPQIMRLHGESTSVVILRVEGYSIALIAFCNQSDESYDPNIDAAANDLLRAMQSEKDLSGTLLIACEEPIYYPQYKRKKLATEGISLERYHPYPEEFENNKIINGLSAQAKKMFNEYWDLRVKVRNQLIMRD